MPTVSFCFLNFCIVRHANWRRKTNRFIEEVWSAVKAVPSREEVKTQLNFLNRVVWQDYESKSKWDYFEGNHFKDKFNLLCLTFTLFFYSAPSSIWNDGHFQVRRHTDWYVEYCARRDKQKEKIGQVSSAFWNNAYFLVQWRMSRIMKTEKELSKKYSGKGNTTPSTPRPVVKKGNWVQKNKERLKKLEEWKKLKAVQAARADILP